MLWSAASASQKGSESDCTVWFSNSLNFMLVQSGINLFQVKGEEYWTVVMILVGLFSLSN
jgi:hypothetical protein